MSGRHPYIPNRPGSVKGKIGSMVAFKQYASAMSCANFRRLRTFMLSEGSDPGDGETGRRPTTCGFWDSEPLSTTAILPE